MSTRGLLRPVGGAVLALAVLAGCSGSEHTAQQKAADAAADLVTLRRHLMATPVDPTIYLEADRTLASNERFADTDGGLLGLAQDYFYRQGVVRTWSRFDGSLSITVVVEWFATNAAAQTALDQHIKGPVDHVEMIDGAAVSMGKMIEEGHGRSLVGEVVRGPVDIFVNVEALDTADVDMVAERHEFVEDSLRAMPTLAELGTPKWFSDAAVDIGHRMQFALLGVFALAPLLGSLVTSALDRETWTALRSRPRRRAALRAITRGSHAVNVRRRAVAQRVASAVMTVVRLAFWIACLLLVNRDGLSEVHVQIAVLLAVRVALTTAVRAAFLGRRGVRRSLQYVVGLGFLSVVVTLLGFVVSTAIVTIGVLAVVLSVSLLFSGAASILQMSHEDLIVAGGVCAGFGVSCFLFAATPLRLARRGARAIAQRRDRLPSPPFVTFLRGFMDDTLVIRPNGVSVQSALDRWSLNRRARFEEVVAWASMRNGPVVAVADPTAPSPPLGAFRTVVPADTDWHEVVNGYMEQSSLVVIVLALTDGTVWEVRRAVKEIADRLIVVVPPVSGAERLEMVDQLYGASGLQTPPDVVAGLDAILAATVKAGAITLYVGESLDGASYAAAIVEASRHLERAPAPAEDLVRREIVPQRPLVTRVTAAADVTKKWYSRPRWLFGIASTVVWVITSAVSKPTTGASDAIDGDALRPKYVVELPDAPAEVTRVDDNSFVVGTNIGSELSLYAVGSTTPQWTVHLSSDVRSAVIVDDEVWVTTRDGAGVRRVAKATGRSLGSVEGVEHSSRVVMTDLGPVALDSARGDVYLLRRDGRVDRHLSISGQPYGVASNGSDLIVTDVSDDRVIWLDTTTGKSVRSVTVESLVRDVVVRGDRVLVAAATGWVFAFDTSTGVRMASGMVSAGATLMRMADDGTVVIGCQAQNGGSIVWTIDPAGDLLRRGGGLDWIASVDLVGTYAVVATGFEVELVDLSA